MGRGRTRAIRLLVAAGLVALLAGVAATVAHALAFDDASPCPDTQPLFVCPQGTVDSAYSVKLVARGGCEPEFIFRVLSGGLPAGLSLASNGQISGTPTTAGTSNFWVQVHDLPPSEGGPVWCSNPKDAERQFSITINPRVLVTTESAPGGTVGAPYTLSLAAAMKTGAGSTSPPSSPLTWSVVSGQLPPGLALNPSTGVVSGTPTTEGSFLATYKASLIDGRSDTKSLEIVVRQPLAVTASEPLATPPLPTVWEVGVPFTAKLTPSGGSGTFTFAIADGALPPGLVLGPDGTLAGRPRAPGGYRATLRLSDTEGRTADVLASFGVAARLKVATRALKPGKVGRLYRARLLSTGGVLPRTWRIVRGPLPKGVHFDRKLGVLLGKPKKAGRYRMTFEVDDGLHVVAKKTLRIIVRPTKVRHST